MILLLMSCLKPPPESPAVVSPYPKARRELITDTYHGVTIADPYRWLEDPDSPETRAWVEAQNTLTGQYLEAIPGRDAIEERLEALWSYERFGLPSRYGQRTFSTHNSGTQEHDVLFVQDADDPPRVLIDPATRSEDGTVSLAGWVPSEDGSLLAYGLSDGGSDWRTWRVMDVATGEDLPDTIEHIKFSRVSWSHDGTGFFYSRYPEPDGAEDALLNQALYHHRLGDPQSADRLIYARPDEPEWGFGGRVSPDGQTLFISIWRSTEDRNQIHTLDLTDPAAEVTPLLADWSAGWGVITAEGRRVWLKTNLDAPRGRVVSVSLDDPTTISEVIPQSEQTLQRVRRVGDQLVLTRLQDARAMVEAWSLEGEPLGEVPLPGIGSVSGFSSRPGQLEGYYSFSSFTTPPTIYRYDTATGQSTLHRAPQLDIDPADYHTEQVFVTSGDGTRVPMFIIRRSDVVPDGDRPTLLYGYGGFNISITPRFSVASLVWMELGGVYAVANLRGGGEYGEVWHRAGTQTDKQNVFDDFIASAEWLIASGITRPERLAISGRSNGGLLVGATLLQRPDLFGAALPAVGVLDMLRYHRFTIGRAWSEDYGTVDDPDQFAALAAYSPVHNVVSGTHYPPTLITTADHDDRVVPAHSYKFAAALQHGQGGPSPALIRIDTRAGHGAGRSASQQIAEIADQWAFLVTELSMEIPEGL